MMGQTKALKRLKRALRQYKNKFTFGLGIWNSTMGILLLLGKHDWELAIAEKAPEALAIFNKIWELGFLSGLCIVYGVWMLTETDFSWLKKKLWNG
jgi:hypothetical protein